MEHWEIINQGNIKVSNTPQELWLNAVEYFRYCDDNPIKLKQTIRAGKGAGTKMEIENQRPYTVKGLCLHCGILEDYIRDVRQSKNESNEYYIVISKILYVIYVHNEELATIGVYSPIFTAKRLNMDSEEVPNKAIRVEIVNGLPTLSKSENEILEKLELENSFPKHEDV